MGHQKNFILHFCSLFAGLIQCLSLFFNTFSTLVLDPQQTGELKSMSHMNCTKISNCNKCIWSNCDWCSKLDEGIYLELVKEGKGVFTNYVCKERVGKMLTRGEFRQNTVQNKRKLVAALLPTSSIHWNNLNNLTKTCKPKLILTFRIRITHWMC